jgi:uncharacterized membrane protein YgdD (TMEM256/DUF423 family)
VAGAQLSADLTATPRSSAARRSIVAEGRLLLGIGGLSLLLATIGGAVGAHVLTHLDERSLRAFDSAVQFQFFQGLGILAMTLAAERGFGGRGTRIAAWLLVGGTILFCGSIYATTFGAPRAVLSVAPYGGVGLMAAWLLFAVDVWLPRASR